MGKEVGRGGRGGGEERNEAVTGLTGPEREAHTPHNM